MSNFDYLMSGIMVAAATIILNMFLTILIRSKVSTMSKWVDFLYKREVRLKRQQEAYQEQKEKEREAEKIRARTAKMRAEKNSCQTNNN